MKSKKACLFFQLVAYGFIFFVVSVTPLWGEPQGRVFISTAYDLPTMDPHMHSVRPMFTVGWHMFDNLVYRDPVTREIGPWLATDWKTLDDLTWEFTLRKGVKFHNGYPFTAHDVKFNFERILLNIKSSLVPLLFSINHHLTGNTAFLFLSLARCRNTKESMLKGRGF